jgi:hypothetical protein
VGRMTRLDATTEPADAVSRRPGTARDHGP